MKVLLNMLNVIEFSDIMKLLIFYSIVFTAFSYTTIYTFSTLFKIKIYNEQKLKFILLEGILNLIGILILPFQFYKLISLCITLVLFKFFLNQGIDKSILGEVMMAITIICTEIFFVRIFYNIFDNVNLTETSMYSYIYQIYLMGSVSIIRLLLSFFVKKKKSYIKMNYDIDSKSKNTIMILSSFANLFIIIDTMQILKHMDTFSYMFLVLNIFAQTALFCASVTNILKIARIKEKNRRIQNLEAYNKTLSVMYDSIRGFKHDFSNFVQALDGYVKTNDMEGIRSMCKSICQECKKVNNMGILDPKIINNPAVYSIITNKYYLAQEENVMMNIEVMFDLQDVKMNSYELCGILGILLDNAIEAAKECNEKVVNVKFIRDIKTNNKLVIVENSYSKSDIDIDKIFEKGYSTKSDSKNEHGLGLWNVKKLVSHCENVNLLTTKGKMFSQRLEIYS